MVRAVENKSKILSMTSFLPYRKMWQPVLIDVDDSIDVYAFLKAKKIVPHIPTLLCYVKGNDHYTPDEVVFGANETHVGEFFERCMELLD